MMTLEQKMTSKDASYLPQDFHDLLLHRTVDSDSVMKFTFLKMGQTDLNKK